jgi:uncharacterized alkaline shock family protein YloU
MDTEYRYFPSRAMITEPSSPLGDIKINYEVIANIVRLSIGSIEGVLTVGGHWWRRVEGAFSSKRDVIDGVYIMDEGGSYAIRVRVQMRFGVELAKVAYEIQNRVRENLLHMANVNVSRVDVIIDGIHENKTTPKA